MYLCFILSVGSIFAFFISVVNEGNNGNSSHVSIPNLNLPDRLDFLNKIIDFFKDTPLSLIIFIFTLLVGFLIKDFLKKYDY